MLCSNDEAMIEKARFHATQARDPAPYYEHTTYGYNYRMSNVLAAIGIAQLEVLPERVARRKEIFEHYESELGKLPGISFMPIAAFGTPNYWLTSMLVEPKAFGKDCETVRQHLESQNIEARRIWKPMHMQPVFAGCRSRGGAFSEELLEQGLNLPSGSAMKTADLERVCRAISELA
jgi:dTDP-4-amino-4,6-dideoxygalactose transaminase